MQRICKQDLAPFRKIVENRVMSSYSTRQFNASDWQTYRDMRLSAINEHRDYFLPTQDEFSFTEEQWKNRLSSPLSANFGLYDGEKLIGLTTIYRENENSTKALMVSSYIKKEYRGKGLSKFLYEDRIAWARKQKGIKTIELEHRDDNLSSQKAHEKFGFKYTGSYMVRWLDGKDRNCRVYELQL